MKKVFQFLQVNSNYQLINPEKPKNQSNQTFRDRKPMKALRKINYLNQIKKKIPSGNEASPLQAAGN